ncbi:tetraacyldisaccharide 4'-kinase [Pseudodesulfovibrio piezophilus]|uniref:Tetraacyldisaccharide 4'-kinase n=1 Tax=Pseudodesulfovibrio piezophilus (strain DSM 21447 / JCM 15486 / C1TLV30) TaxID=1322246 RepID=M1WMU2_PSEP2|nr:tetraacyldisaccharide 4'-kinase [Pseudodesulfovibrio piezophilus]CCH49965.1 Tetraacyldisaccharide 4'-kinase [Pseudodesulfovibrio piezophilus C1TLV30]
MPDSITTIQTLLSPMLKPLSWGYGALMRLRENLYGYGLFTAWKPTPLTVSVGNIGWGGSGKTPIAGWLLDWAKKNNLRPLLLTRGYKAKPVSYPYRVLPGALPEEAGDEPLMLATTHPEAHIIVDPVRTRGGKLGVRQFKPHLIVLDDGFQHMAVARDFNLVLLRPEDLSTQWNAVTPAGSWREPVSALKRADAFMVKAGPAYFKRLLPLFKERLDHLHKPFFSFRVVPTSVSQIIGPETAENFEGAGYLLVTGVGDPELVKRTATQFLGYPPVRHMIYRDHHSYTKSDMLEMQATARKLGCKTILCTPKDAVKLGPMCNEAFWQFDLRVEFGPSSIGEKVRFDTWWNRHHEKLSKRRRGEKEKQHSGEKSRG